MNPPRDHTPRPAPAPRGLRRAVQVGPRVFLRHPTGADRPAYIKLREQSEAFLHPWEPTPPGRDTPFPPGESFDRLLESADLRDAQRFLVCALADGSILGQVSLNHIARGAFLNAILGYWVGAPFARQGFITEAITLALAHAFGPLDLHRVEANIIPTNTPSLGVVKKLGFRFEGAARAYLRINAKWQDHQHWAITSDEWAARIAQAPSRAPAPTRRRRTR